MDSLPHDEIMNCDTAPVTVTAIGITRVSNAAKLIALADVEVVIDGVVMLIQGVQVRADGDGTAINLPKYRAPDGAWRSAVILPDETSAAIVDTVLAAGLEAKILREEEETLADKCMEASATRTIPRDGVR